MRSARCSSARARCMTSNAGRQTIRNGDYHATVRMQLFLFRLNSPRPTFAQDMTDTERAAMLKHVAYWRELLDEGTAIVFGPVADPKGTWGVGIVRVED